MYFICIEDNGWHNEECTETRLETYLLRVNTHFTDEDTACLLEQIAKTRKSPRIVGVYGLGYNDIGDWIPDSAK